MIFFLLIFLGFISLATNASSNDCYDFNRVAYAQDIAASNVRRLAQDSDGYLWIGTDHGLLRYDGYTFRGIKNKNGEYLTNLNSSVRAIEDYKNYIWVGSAAGLYKVNKHTLYTTKVTVPPLYTCRIEDIEIAGKDSLWIATTKGVFLYDINTNTYTQFLKNTFCNSVMVDSRGRVWVTTWAQGIMKLSLNRKYFVRYPQISESNGAYCTFEDHKKNIWVGTTNNGLILLKNENIAKTVKYQYFKHQPEQTNSLISNTVYCIKQEPRTKQLWVGTQSGLSILTHGEKSNSFVNKYKINSNDQTFFDEVNAIICDKTGVMWAASLFEGIVKYNPHKIKNQHIRHAKIFNDLRTTMVLDYVPIGAHQACLNIKGKGLFLIDTDTDDYKSFSDLLGCELFNAEGEGVQEMQYCSRTNTLLCMLRGSVCTKVFFKNNVPYKYEKIAYDNTYMGAFISFLNSQDQELGLICKNGIAVLQNNQRNHLFPDFKITCATTQRQDGTVWLGTEWHGIKRIRITQDSIQLLDCKHQPSITSEILSIYQDAENNIWIGTRFEGLYYIKNGSETAENLNDKYKLADKMLFNIFSSPQGDIYMCSLSGLIRIDTANESSAIYPNSIFKGNTFHPRSNYTFLDKDNVLICGTQGYNILNFENLYHNTLPPQPVLTDILVRGTSIYSSNELFSNCISDKDSNTIVLANGQGEITFNFSVLNTYEPAGNTFSFMLKGVDTKPRYVDASERTINYSNLKKGNYQLILNAANEYGLWSPKPFTYNVIIKPSPFDTWYAYMIYTIIIAIISAITLKIVRARIKLNNLLQQAQLKQKKNDEVNQAKMIFFTNVSHELLTPLSIIKCSVDSLEENKFEEANQKNIIISNINRLNRLIRQILEFRKAESSNLKLKVSYANISQFIETICINNFQPLITEQQVSFSVLSTPNNIYGYADFDKIDKIMYNLLSNAFKYNKTNGFVHVTINEEKDGDDTVCIISVKDGGIGIAEKQLTSIFDRFYENDYRSIEKIGNGIGLSLTRDLVRIHKGDISVQSAIGIGTTFTVKFPINVSRYESNEIMEEFEQNQTAQIQDIEKELPELVKAKTLLIVEDNHDMQYITKLNLKDNYKIIQAYNGVEAMQIIQDNPEINMIISDIMMPEMNGLELCQKVKNNVEYCHIPFILLTAKNSEEDRVEGYSMGADGFIGKPFSMDVLKSRILNLLSKQEQKIQNFRESDNSEIATITNNPIDEDILNRVIVYIENNIENNGLSINDICSEMAMSRSTLYRKIMQITGMSTVEIIRNTRLKIAKRMLRENPMTPISEVAYATGFTSQKYFSNCFKKEFSITPTEYQKSVN